METPWVLVIEADAEVIPGPESQIRWAVNYIKDNYGTEETPE